MAEGSIPVVAELVGSAQHESAGPNRTYIAHCLRLIVANKQSAVQLLLRNVVVSAAHKFVLLNELLEVLVVRLNVPLHVVVAEAFSNKRVHYAPCLHLKLDLNLADLAVEDAGRAFLASGCRVDLRLLDWVLY